MGNRVSSLLRTTARIAFVLVLLLACASAPGEARVTGNPAERLARQPVDAYAYDYAKGCLHRTQAGTRALEAWLRRTRPRGGSWGTESCRKIPVSKTRLDEWRSCARRREAEPDPGLRKAIRCPPRPRPSWSLHAEGRALDWRLDRANRADRGEAKRLIRLLLASDSTGTPHALARRMGIQEIIWDCRAWWSGQEDMRPYGPCFDAKGERRRDVDRTIAHRDHMHLGLTWAGARLRSSFWRSRSAG